MKQIFEFAFSPSLPAWMSHVFNHKVLEDDNIFLHHQGQSMAPNGRQEPGKFLQSSDHHLDPIIMHAVY